MDLRLMQKRSVRWLAKAPESPVPRASHRNLVDAAIADPLFHDLDREIHWISGVRG